VRLDQEVGLQTPQSTFSGNTHRKEALEGEQSSGWLAYSLVAGTFIVMVSDEMHLPVSELAAVCLAVSIGSVAHETCMHCLCYTELAFAQ
jgi:hypothetical protein